MVVLVVVGVRFVVVVQLLVVVVVVVVVVVGEKVKCTSPSWSKMKNFFFVYGTGIRTSVVEHYAYSTSKAAVHRLSEDLAGKLGDKHITVNRWVVIGLRDDIIAAAAALAMC